MKKIYEVPVPSTSFERGGAFMCGDTICFEYYRGEETVRGGIRFHNVAAERKRAERCSTAFHLENCYDVLVEVEDSTWVAQIYGDTDKNWRGHWKMNHYMIYLDGSGCFEIIADGYEILPEEKGSWLRGDSCNEA